MNDLFSFYLKWEGIPEDKKYFIDKIKKDEGLISFITRITKEDDYDGYRNFFIQYILIYERILYDIENNTPVTVSQTKEQEKKQALPLRMNWVGEPDELAKTLNELKGDLNFINVKTAVLNDDIKLKGVNTAIDALAIFYVLVKYNKVKLMRNYYKQITETFSNVNYKTLKNYNKWCDNLFSKTGLNKQCVVLDEDDKDSKNNNLKESADEKKIKAIIARIKHFEKKLSFLKKI